MKKVGFLVAAILTALLLVPAVVSAMTVNNPVGTQISGWYKDNFTVTGTYAPTCILPALFQQFTYSVGAEHNGSHVYIFFRDNFDTPFVSVDTTGTPIRLAGNCPVNPPYQVVKNTTVNLDAQAPTISISSPASGTSTTATAIPVNGYVSDSESGIEKVTGTVNGIAISGVNLSSNTFAAPVNLSIGTNNIQFTAYDKVGHATNSASIQVTRTSTSAGGTSGSGSTTTTPPATPAANPSPPTTTTSNISSTSTPVVSAQSPVDDKLNAVKATDVKYSKPYSLNIKDIASEQNSLNPSSTLAASGLAGARGWTYNFLIGLATLLLLLCLLIFFTRFRQLFGKLDKNNSGLRRRIILIVTIPSLIPLLGLGYLGYHQLTASVRDSLSSQLYRAAQTSSLKLERDFAMRRSVITKSTSDILQIQNQLDQQHTQLADQKQKCSSLVQSAIPKKQYSTVTGSDDCLPFLAGFAQLVSSSASTVASYQKALDDGYIIADQALTTDEQQRINELLGAVRKYFPDLLELSVTDNADKSKQIALLPAKDSGQYPVTKTHADLLKTTQKSNLIIYDNTQKSPFVLLTYPVNEGNDAKGLAVAAFGFAEDSFITDIYNSTPKPYADNKVFIVNTDGALIFPNSGEDSTTVGQNRALAALHENRLQDMDHIKQHLVARSSKVVGTNWSVAVAAPAKTILTPLAGVQRTALLAIACFIMLSLLLAVVFVYGIANEIEKLLAGALQYAKGNLDYRIMLQTKDELQMLGDTMDQMAGEIKTAQDALIEKDKEFINIATHELKAPMTAILGNLNMIMEEGIGQVDDTARGLLGQAYLGTQRLRNLVTDMLDVARLESGHSEFSLEPLDITAITMPIIEMQEAAAHEAKVSLHYQPTSDLPTVMADKNKLQIIITNFISNAIKYNKEGGDVTITHTFDGSMISTSVIDTGLGIPDDQKDHMFEKFYRVKHEDRANVPGTGLGMHITKRFIEGMGGSVGFESVHGKGTTFHFTLPTQTQASQLDATSTVTQEPPIPLPQTQPIPSQSSFPQ